MDHVIEAWHSRPIGGVLPPCPRTFKDLEPVSLTYQQTVDTLLAHGADVSACNAQVIMSGWCQLEMCYIELTALMCNAC